MAGRILAIPIGVCTLGYLACVLYLLNYYLPKYQPSTWTELGRPLVQHPIVRLDGLQSELEKWLMTARFMLWSDDYERLQDTRLTRLIWCSRSLAAGCLVAWALVLGLTFLNR